VCRYISGWKSPVRAQHRPKELFDKRRSIGTTADPTYLCETYKLRRAQVSMTISVSDALGKLGARNVEKTVEVGFGRVRSQGLDVRLRFMRDH
jgi:hypothetical protein